MTDFIDNEGPDVFDPQVQKALENAHRLANAGDDKRAEQEMQALRLAYVEVFTAGVTSQAAIDIVMNDLGWFGKAWIGTYDVRDGEHAATLQQQKEGRRSVWLRIVDFAKLDIGTLMLKYNNALNK